MLKMPSWHMMSLNDPMNLSTAYMTSVYNVIMEVMMFVAVFISSLIILLLMNKFNNRKMTSSNLLEVIWTLMPMMFLVYMAAPSLQLLYLLEESESPSLSIKILGHQWYWSYEYPELMKMFDSYMNFSKFNNFRLLDVDNRVIMPFNINTRLLCTSTDVIHSWAIPSMSIKMDALPGRINQMSVFPISLGMFFGQCSEICGMNHSFMPIVTEVIPVPVFIEWAKTIE